MTGMHYFTITAHSGLGHTALEAQSVVSASQQNAIRKAGGVLVDTYAKASDLEVIGVVYPSEFAIAPCGVRGDFHPTTEVDGLAVWVPDRWVHELLELADALPGRRLSDVADVLATTHV